MNTLLRPEDNIPGLYSAINKTDPDNAIIHMKLEVDDKQSSKPRKTWYVAEWDGENKLFAFIISWGDVLAGKWDFTTLTDTNALRFNDRYSECQRDPTWKPTHFEDIDLEKGVPKKQLDQNEDGFVLPATYANTDLHHINVAKGFNTIAPICILHEREETIVALQMLGEPEQVNASWAALMNGGSTHYIMNTVIKLKGMKAHIRLNKPLPDSEFKETWLIHKQATLEHLNPAIDYFYLIQFEAGIPKNFYAMLDKNIGTPTLPEWTEFLWRKGGEKKLINKNRAIHAVGHNCWVIRTHLDFWLKIIQNGLSSGEITF